MRITISFSLIFSLVDAQTHLQVERCTPITQIYCGDELHILSKHDCDRGLIYEYCVKTLTRRTPATDHCLPKTAYNWTTNRPWRLLVSAIPIMPPCLSVDDRSLTIVCVEGPCNDARLTEDIAVCAERYSRGLVHFMDWSPGNNIPPASVSSLNSMVTSADQPIVRECPPSTPPSPEYLLYTSVFTIILMLALLSLQFLGMVRNATKLEKVHQDVCLNAAVPTVPRSRLDSSYEALPRDI